MRLLTPLVCLLGVLALAPRSHAQVIAVHFKDEKAAGKYKDHLTEYRGELVVIGEPKVGFVYSEQNHNLSYVPNGSNELFVVDPKDPGKFAYFVVDGERVEASKKNKLVIQGAHVKGLTMLMRDQTLPGLSKEYNIRTQQIEEFRADRDRYDKTSREWQARHVRLVTAMERLVGWLESTGFPAAIKSLQKDLAKENKAARDEAIRARGQAALDSVEACEVPETLKSLSQEASGGHDVFHGFQSQHLRIYYCDPITDAEAEAALELGERVIEGFRAEFVDPYLAEDYVDHIPDRRFHEFLFVPDDIPKYEKYTTGFYGVSWRENREQRLAMGGGRTTGGRPEPMFIDFWKMRDNDLQGIVCHSLGHSLASLHYGGGMSLNQDWLAEAVGYQVSFEHLGRNNVTCKAFDKEKSGYLKRDKQERKEGEKTVGEGRRDVYNQVALSEGRSIDQIALKTLFELEDADLAKSWSFYDYVCRKEGKAGQEWLRAAGECSRNRQTFLQKWREAAASILTVSPGEAFRSLEERWRSYASTEQSTD
ncbi:MAG: hypothetical protein H6828_08430 [Planctomycetes bacterium]|nr:hypothetical protein [Planctomycetota bacterium]